MTSNGRRFLPSALCPAVLLALAALATPDGATAATFAVTNLADSGPGSLRQAVLDANASLGADQVVFTPGLNGTIALTSGEIVIADSLIVAGPGAGMLTVDADFDSRIFRIESPAAPAIDVTLSGLTLTRGHSGEYGGTVLAWEENLTILDSVISEGSSGVEGTPPADGCGGNVALIGSPEPPTETLRIVNSTLIDGTVRSFGFAWGGNLCVSFGRLILERSTVSGGAGSHFSEGGGIFLFSPAENSVILNSTISGNTAGSGGGIAVWQTPGNLNLRIESSTISGNSAVRSGGGIFLIATSGSLLLRLTTVSNNSAPEGGSIQSINSQVQVQLDHSIVANGAPYDLAGDGITAATVTANYSLIESPGDTILLGANNLIGIDPLLGPLTSNGGPTLTHSPLPGSPVLDTGDPAIPDPPPTDQRGFARIIGPAIDRGSVEGQQQGEIAEVPTLSQWAMLVLSALLFAGGVRRLRRAGPALLLALVCTRGATAATFTVTNLADSGPGSLRQTVLDANASPGADQVVFTPGLNGTIALTSGEIVIADSLTVAGPGASMLTVTTSLPRTRIFRVESPAAAPIDATLLGLTLTGGYSTTQGGAVLAYGENLTVLDSVVSDSTSGYFTTSPPLDGCGGNVALIGNAASPMGTLRIVNSTLIGGTSLGDGGHGGNLCVEGGRLLLERSTVSGGSVLGWGGGIVLLFPAEDSVILSSTISGNNAGSGGGIAVWQPAGNLNLMIESSTISGNSAEGMGGGIFLLVTSGSLLLRLTTVSNNSASEGGSILNTFQVQVQLDHSIVANGTPEDLAGGTATAHYSLIESPGTTILLGANNLIGIDPLLGPLTSNGGPTLTHSPLPGSPVLDTGDPAIPDPPPTDQRGFARIIGPAIDRGSVEGQQQGEITEVPTLSQWAMLVLSALLFAAGVRRLRRAGLALLLALVFAELATAATFTVDNLNDAGPGSLRQAVLNANAEPGADEIAFEPGLTGTIKLTSGEITIADSLVVNGPGAGVLTVDGNSDSRIFNVANGTAAPIDVTLSGLTLTRGYTALVGGAVFSDNENLTIVGSVISDGQAGYFGTPPAYGCGGNVAFVGSYTGGISGTLRIIDSTLTRGFVDGFLSFGANVCAAYGTFVLERSTVSNGQAWHGWGGGIYLEQMPGGGTILFSTIYGNEADLAGGGIYATDVDLTIESSTISGNSVLYRDDNTAAGGIRASSLVLRRSTVMDNRGGVGSIWAAQAHLDHSIVANGAPQDLSGSSMANHSLIESPGTTILLGASNLLGIDPLLGPLTSNGGPTLTHLPLPGSPVIDAGNPAIPAPPATDQRGLARIAGPAVDMGSVEAGAVGAVAVPTLSEWSLILLSGLLLAAGVWRLRAF